MKMNHELTNPPIMFRVRDEVQRMPVLKKIPLGVDRLVTGSDLLTDTQRQDQNSAQSSRYGSNLTFYQSKFSSRVTQDKSPALRRFTSQKVIKKVPQYFTLAQNELTKEMIELKKPFSTAEQFKMKIGNQNGPKKSKKPDRGLDRTIGAKKSVINGHKIRNISPPLDKKLPLHLSLSRNVGESKRYQGRILIKYQKHDVDPTLKPLLKRSSTNLLQKHLGGQQSKNRVDAWDKTNQTGTVATEQLKSEKEFRLKGSDRIEPFFQRKQFQRSIINDWTYEQKFRKEIRQFIGC